MRATFRDPELEAQLDRDGYAVVPLLGPDEVEHLRAEFHQLGPAPGDPHLACHSSFHSFDRDYKVSVDTAVRTALGPHLESTFDRQRALPCNFIVKWPGGRSGFGLHQDLSLVDESKFRSVEVWIALDDTSPENGQLWMVPGSHRWLPGNIRGIHAFPFAFEDVARRIIDRHAVAVPVPSGHAVVFSHSTLHFSMPNRSDEPRLVAITDLIPEEAEHLHYFGDGEGHVDAYAIDEQFWIDNSPFTLWQPPPASRRVGAVDASAQSMDDVMLDVLIDEGLARDETAGPRGAINAAKPWCHRCGSTDVHATVDRWVGNVTLLCDSCRRVELGFASSPAHVGSRVDGELESQLHDRGVAVVSLLDPPTVAKLADRFAELGRPVDEPFFASSNDLDRTDARALDLEIKGLVAEQLSAVLPGWTPFLAGFICKGADGPAVDFHQDLTYCDERRARAIVAWIPLVDVDSNSGALLVVAGSHRWTTGIRPGGTLPAPTLEHQDAFAALAETVDLAAGSALLWDAATVHGSSPNTTGHSRAAVAVALVRNEVPLVHFHATEQSPDAAGFDIGEEFFTTQEFRARPAGYPNRQPWTDPVRTADFVEPVRLARSKVVESVEPAHDSASEPRRPVVSSTSVARAARRAPVLNDPTLDARLLRDGFTQLDIITPATADALREEFGRLRGWSGEGFHSDLVLADHDYRRAADEVLSEALDRAIAPHFDGYTPFLRNFLCKWPGVDSELYLHRDWMYIDERDGEATYVVWVPLEDITGHNGQLRVLRGSQRLDESLRGTDLIAPWLDHEEVIDDRLLTVPSTAGRAIVFDNALTHCSYPNHSDRPRVAAAIGLRPTTSKLVHFRRVDDHTAVRYDVDESFFLEQTPQGLMAAPPDLPVAETISIGSTSLTAPELAVRLDHGAVARVDRIERSARRLMDESLTRLGEAQDRVRNASRRIRTLADDPSALRRSAASLIHRAPSSAAMAVLAANEAAITRFGPDTPPIWDPRDFEWAERVENAYADVRAEVEAVLAGPTNIPHIEDVTGGIPQGNVGPWRSFVLMHQGRWIDWNCDRCPRTTDLVRSIPGLTMAGFSVLEPGTHITEHRGPNKGALRYQLGVIVPGADGDCRIRVGEEMIHWRNGEGVMFDFTFPHEAWNDSDGIRVLLMLEVITPLPKYLDVPNRLAQHAMGWFPTTRDMRRRLAQLEPTLTRAT